ncbi:hypothetical protein BKA65DRAFT_522545 [Rhexocercosporidium sp. MPI-PUGE-AT-0058]|nr:hypothetical protein BKA65DRAFT_522545 [Rhexocercosporidium sp. MPI-PUGE-AT-0058]
MLMASKVLTNRPLRETAVLSLGCLRTGSASICEALTILNYQDVHHGINAAMQPADWPIFSAASDAIFPSLPNYNGNGFTRAQWDQIFGPCEAITDMGSFFASSLIAAYPKAKVILVERDIEQWYASMEEAIFGTTWGYRADFFIDFLVPLFGGKAGTTIRKIMYGYFESKDVTEMRAKAKERYTRHYAEIRAAVPSERLLNFRLADGWAPLCEFLGRDVPNVPFPRVNERQVHLKRVRDRQNHFFKMALKIGLKRAFPWALGLISIGLGVFAVRCPDLRNNMLAPLPCASTVFGKLKGVLYRGL